MQVTFKIVARVTDGRAYVWQTAIYKTDRKKILIKYEMLFM